MRLFNVLKNLATQKIDIKRISGYQSYYLSNAGSGSLTLTKTVPYLVAVIRQNTATASYQGLYLLQVHNSSVIVPIATCSAITMSIDSNAVLSFTTTQNYMYVIAIPLITA